MLIQKKLNQVELTGRQKEFFDIMKHKDTRIVFLSGPSGTSKTFLAIYTALHLYSENKSLDIHYLRTVVESASKSMGYLKGDMESKFEPYMMPLLDKINELLDSKDRQELQDKKVLSASPINFVRGQDWKNKIVIADEMQNATVKEILTVATRLNYGSKLFICGDKIQNDIKNSGFSSCLTAFDDKASREVGIFNLKFGHEDIMRDEVVSFVIERLESFLNLV